MRVSFANSITEIAQHNDNVVLLSGDIGNRMFDDLQATKPNQFYNCGIAEANMMSVAAGMALSGLKPFVYTITPFTTTRCLEQIRVDVCYHDAPVVIVGTGSGLSYAQLGPTHHSLEDIAIMRALPNMTVFCPCDALEVQMGIKAALNYNKPLYIRLGKKGEAVFHKTLREDFSFGRSITIRPGNDVCILSVGNAINVAMEAAELLAASNIDTCVESFHTIKPLDTNRLTAVFNKFEKVCILEEHSKIGGLTSAISDWLIQNAPEMGYKFCAVNFEDKFQHYVTSQNNLREMNSFTAQSIFNKLSHLGY